MKKTLLFEIGLEEVPAKYVRNSSIQLKERLITFLKEKRIEHGEVSSFATPRRLAVMIKEVSDKQTDIIEKSKGPARKIAVDADGNWTKAAIGFARGQGLSPDDLSFEEIKGIDYLHANKEVKGSDTIYILRELPAVIKAMTFPVSMHWGTHTFKYIRPIHWIVALLGEEVIPFELLDVQSGRSSQGHRFLGNEVIIESAEDYVETLEEQLVLVDMERRKNMILQQIQKIEKENNWHVPMDDDLLEEVNSLVEYPTAFYGDFDEKYLALPDEVLITSMKEHQRYFEVQDKNGSLLPHFISVRNGNEAFIDQVKKGNQKVLTARLDDAIFFFEEDQKMSMEDSLAKLKHVSFHAKIGSLAQKMEQVTQLSELLATKVGMDTEALHHLDRAAHIYKFDLVSNMVSEFPELQGVIGEKYALLQGESREVATAIREHYLPLSSEGVLPQTVIGAVLAASDKLDSIISFFIQEMIPTGSNDPYALRRQMIGLIQIIESYNWTFSFKGLLNELLQSVYSIKEPAHLEQLINQIFEFSKGRIQQKLNNYKIAYDVQEAVLQASEDDVNVILSNALTLQQHHSDDDFKAVMESLARVVNISNKVQVPFEVDSTLLETTSEKNLHVQINHLKAIWGNATSHDKYAALKDMVPYITAYFDENMVMVEDQAIKENRLNTLASLNEKIINLADVRKIVTK